MIREGTELAIGFVLLAGVAGYGGYAVGRYQSQAVDFQQPAAPAAGIGNSAGSGEQGAVASFTIAAVAQHSTPQDCWIVVSGRVYGVSGYLGQHPGGAAVITPYCGQDATQAFATKGGQGQHSALAQQELSRLYLGTLGETAPTAPVASNAGSTPAPVTNPPASVPAVGTSVSLALTEVAAHNIPADCWLVISNKVYDVTNYLNLHPGGRNRIIPYCGQDATQAFATKGGQGQHSAQAQQDLAAFYLGPVGGSSNASSGSPLPAPSAMTGGNGEDEWEDD